jgi:hypothetical protein
LVLVIAATGFASMAFELILIFMFQSLLGYIYASIGCLIAMFMLGLAGGAFLMGRYLESDGKDAIRKFWIPDPSYARGFAEASQVGNDPLAMMGITLQADKRHLPTLSFPPACSRYAPALRAGVSGNPGYGEFKILKPRVFYSWKKP